MAFRKIACKALFPLLVLLFAIEVEAQVARPADLFFKVCMGSLGNKSQGGEAAQKFGLVRASDEQAQSLLRKGATGVVYVGGENAVVLEDGGLCTVFAHVEDAGLAQRELENALPPPSTPFKVSKEAMSNHQGTASTVYHLSLPNGPFADWVFSSYSRPGKYNVAISMQPPSAR